MSNQVDYLTPDPIPDVVSYLYASADLTYHSFDLDEVILDCQANHMLHPIQVLVDLYSLPAQHHLGSSDGCPFSSYQLLDFYIFL